MATRIRLARGGKKHSPFYRIVVVDSRSPRDGKFIERIGSYDPLLKENKSSVNVERATYWLGVGAKPSERVSKLLALAGVEHKLVVTPMAAPPAAATAAAEPDKAAAKPKAKAAGEAKEAAAAEAAPAAEPAPEKAEAGGESAS